MPVNAMIRDFTIEFDKSNYIESQQEGCFKLKDETPLNEHIIFFVEVDEIKTQYEFVVDSNIYEVYNAVQLRKMANDPYGYFKLMSDIDLSEIQWLPIKNFLGVLNGNNYSILNFAIYLSKDFSNNCDYGLFKELNGVVKDLTIKNTDLIIDKYNDANESLNVGVVCAILNQGYISNVEINDTIMWAYHYRAERYEDINVNAGGFVGLMKDGIMENCVISNLVIHTKSGTVTNIGDAHSYAGGFVGEQINGIIKNCEIKNDIFIESLVRGNSKNSALRACAGGIVGYQSFYGQIVVKNQKYTLELTAVFDIEYEWLYYEGSFAITGDVCALSNGKIVYK